METTHLLPSSQGHVPNLLHAMLLPCSAWLPFMYCRQQPLQVSAARGMHARSAAGLARVSAFVCSWESIIYVCPSQDLPGPCRASRQTPTTCPGGARTPSAPRRSRCGARSRRASCPTPEPRHRRRRSPSSRWNACSLGAHSRCAEISPGTWKLSKHHGKP